MLNPRIHHVSRFSYRNQSLSECRPTCTASPKVSHSAKGRRSIQHERNRVAGASMPGLGFRV